MTGRSRTLMIWLLVLVVVVGTGCSSIPADPDGTLDRVRSGVLRVGVSANPPWTVVDGAEPGGIEPELVREFASGLRAQVEWRVGGEEVLILELEHGRLDLVIGGLTADTPWSDQAAITKAFAEGPDATGEVAERVMAAPMGENAFLLQLEKFLLSKAKR